MTRLVASNMHKLYLGCGPFPIHPQHLQVLGNIDEWTLVDLFIEDPKIKQWDATKLWQVEDGSVEHIYASHLLEHIEHGKVAEVLKLWWAKLKPEGKLTINVPDLMWALNRLKHLESGGIIDGYYNQYHGEHGIMSILYGSQSHEGEYHKSGFTKNSLEKLLLDAGFTAEIQRQEDAHEMGVLLAVCQK